MYEVYDMHDVSDPKMYLSGERRMRVLCFAIFFFVFGLLISLLVHLSIYKI